jgi:hypothetical protein
MFLKDIKKTHVDNDFKMKIDRFFRRVKHPASKIDVETIFVNELGLYAILPCFEFCTSRPLQYTPFFYQIDPVLQGTVVKS